MSTFRRLTAVGSVLGLAAVITCSHVWGEPANDRAKEKILSGRTDPAPAKERDAQAGDVFAATKFARHNVLTYRTQDGDTLFAFQLKAKLEQGAVQPRDYLVMVDTSASQVGTPLAASLQIVEALAGSVNADDKVALWTINTPKKTRSLTGDFVSKDALKLKDAVANLKKEVPLGDTDLKSGLEKAIDSFAVKAGRQRVLVFLGDGMSVHNPVADPDRLALTEKMVQKQIGFFPIPLGPQIESRNIHGLASGTGGIAVRVLANDKIEDVVARLAENVKVPVLYPKKFELSANIVESMPTKLPPLRADAPTLMMGRVKPGKTVECTVEGTVAGRDVRVKITEELRDPELDNFFLVTMADQWRKAKESPGLIRGDRLVAFAFEQNRLARDEFLAQAEWALGRNELAAAENLFKNARNLDPHDVEAEAGLKVVAKLRDGKLKKEQLDHLLPKDKDKLFRVQKGENGANLGRIERGQMLALLAQADPDKPAPGKPNEVAPPVDPDKLMDLQKQKLAIEEQRMGEVVNDALRQARRELQADPREAVDRLKRLRENVKDNADLGDGARRQFVNRLEGAIRDNEIQGARILRNREEQAQRLADARRLQEIEEQRLSAAEKTRQQVRAFGDLMQTARYQEAYQQAIAMQQDAVNRGAPIPVEATATRDMGMMANNIEITKEIVRKHEAGYLATMWEVDKSAIPFPDEPPLHFPPATSWRKLSEYREKRYGLAGLDGSLIPAITLKLRAKMNEPVSLEKGIDANTPLKDALEFLSDRHSTRDTPLTILIDTAAFEEQGLKEVENQPVKLPKLIGVSLSTVLRLLLSQLSVPGTYLIRREFIEITTGQRALLEKAVRAYPVADLVVPIPSSVNTNVLNQNLNVLGQTFSAGGGLGGLGGIGLGGLGALGGGLGALGGGLGLVGGGLGALGGGLGALGGGGALGGAGLMLGGLGAGGNVGALGGVGGGAVNLGFGGGLMGIGGGALGQFGNLGGQFGLQGGTTEALLIQLITTVVSPGEWAQAPAFNNPGGVAPLPGAGPDPNVILNPEQLNSIGYYPPSLALVVRGTSRIHTRLGGGLLGPRPGAGAPPAAAQGPLDPKREGALVIDPTKKDPKAPVVKNDPKQDPKKPVPAPVNTDPTKIWQDALVKGVKDPGIIIATADFLVEQRKYDHAAEFLKANLRAGIIARPWVYEALAIALQLSNGSPEEIEQAQVSAVDLEPQDARGYLKASQAMANHNRFDRAVAFCRQAALLEPGLADSYADTLAYAEMGKDADAMTWAARELLQRDWAANNDDLHAKAKDKLSTLAKLLLNDKRQAEAGRMLTAAEQARERDLVIILSWQGDADIDLKVFEPIGTKCSLLQRQTLGGGTLLGDTLSDMTRETYVAAQAFTGEYEVTLERVWGRPLGGKATVEIIKHQGTPRQTIDRRTITFDRNHSFKLTLDAGRRTTVAAVPLPAAKKAFSKDEQANGDRVLTKLRNLADPIFATANADNMPGGVAAMGVEMPSKEQIVNDAKRKAMEESATQTKMTPFVSNGADMVAELSAEGLRMKPIFQTAAKAQGVPVIRNPLLPGGN